MSETKTGPAGKSTRTRARKLRFTRIRFVSSELSATPDARAQVQVVLADGKKRFQAEAEGVGGETVVLRLAVEAAIDALHSITDSAGRLQLVGIKLVHAFDGSVVLVCLSSTLWPDAKLLGAVPVRDSLEEAAARAVLAAANRLVEKPDLGRESNDSESDGSSAGASGGERAAGSGANGKGPGDADSGGRDPEASNDDEDTSQDGTDVENG